MVNFLKFFIGILNAGAFFLLFSGHTFAQEYYFQEEFNHERPVNTLDSKWVVYPNTSSNIATIRETGGNLITYQAAQTHQFPYIVSKNALPDGNFSIEIKFQYTLVSNWGTGIALADKAFENESSAGPLLAIDAWQDTSNQPRMRLEFNGQSVYGISSNTNPHVFRIDRVDQKYLIYFDGVLVFTTPDTAMQVRDIWMGNPTYQSGLVPTWTKFNVDYIRVKSLASTKTPLIFIPGIGGSELKITADTIWSKDDGHGGTYSHAYTSGEKVWVNEPAGAMPGDDDYFDILRMKPDGQTGEANLELAGNIYAGAYGAAVNFFTNNGYTLNQDLFVFPYDWRKDVALTAPLLDQKIESIKQQTGSQKVDIVAHSLGGLVARNYIADPVKALKVRKLITLGTPNLGTPYFLKVLMYGDCLTDPRLKDFPLCIGVNPSEIKDVSRDMISGFEVAPSQKYYEFYNGSDSEHPLPFVDNSDIDNNGTVGFLNYQQIKTMLTNLNYNTSLFIPSEAFHNLDNSLASTNGVDVYIISGSGQATTGQMIEDYYMNLAGIKIPKTDIRKINGDDTVPIFSSSLIDGSKSIAGSAKVYFVNQHHGNLPSSGSAMDLVKNILVGGNNIPPGISDQPFPFSGNALSVHSPVLIHAYDASGNHTGPLPNGDLEVNIPGSSYEVLGDAKFIFLPNDGQYNLKFEATDQGSFDFKIREYENNINDKMVLYKNIPLTQNTKAETTYDTLSLNPPVLQIDADGNGTIDTQQNVTNVVEGSAVYDQTSPKTSAQLTGTMGNNGWYKSDVEITLIAQDETGGSGISKTEYSFDNGQTVQVYTQPFVISQEETNKLKFRSIDNAGNEEIPQEAEIKIDKTAPGMVLSASPNSLWPPNKKLIDVKISGNILDNLSGVASKTFSIIDDYQQPVPVIYDFNQVIKLEAWRNGDDKDGRIYEIKVIGEDLAGNQAVSTTQVIVPHDQRKK